MTEARACSDQHVVVIGGANSAGQAAVYFGGYAAQGDDARARPLAGEVDVALPDRADRRACRTSRCAPAPRPSPPRPRTGACGALRVRGPDGEETLESTPASCSSAPLRAPTGWRAWWPATSAASSSPAATRRPTAGRCSASPTCWRPRVPGVFVAGDVRARSIKRVASAVGEGSMAVSLIHEYLVEA